VALVVGEFSHLRAVAAVAGALIQVKPQNKLKLLRLHKQKHLYLPQQGSLPVTAGPLDMAQHPLVFTAPEWSGMLFQMPHQHSLLKTQ
jgi:hypothetical protein